MSGNDKAVARPTRLQGFPPEKSITDTFLCQVLLLLVAVPIQPPVANGLA